MTSTRSVTTPVPPTTISLIRWVAATQVVSLLGFAAVAVAFALRTQSAPPVTTGWGDFRGVLVFGAYLVAVTAVGAALAIGLPTFWLRRHHAMARIALITGEYVAGVPVALALVSNVHAHHRTVLLLLGTGYVVLTVTALLGLHHRATAAWSAEPR